MPNPKRRASKARRDRRRSAWRIRLEAPRGNKCPQCGDYKLPHHACPHCGYYNGRPVFIPKEAS
jgi:large subunit ribosomal protein L32